MRAHLSAGGRAQSALAPFAPGNIFERDVTGLPAAGDQTPARKIGNQLAYNRTDYTHWSGYEGPGYTSSGKPTQAQLSTFSPTLWVVPADQPTQKVTYVNAAGEPEPEGASHGLQAAWENVPVPTLANIPSGNLVTELGTDGWMCILQRGTDRMWEFWRVTGTPPSLKARYGGFVDGVSKWNGIFANSWGARATSLALIGGMISQQDLVQVQAGGSINHALIVLLPVTKTGGGPVAPATRNDEQTNTPELFEGKPNPAFGTVDGVAEASWFRYPPGSTPGEYGITKPLEKAIFEAIRKYGLFVGDSGGQAPTFNIESALASGSPYAWHKVNPLAGAPTRFGGSAWIPASWRDPALPPIVEEIEGSASCFTKQPWQILELLTARNS